MVQQQIDTTRQNINDLNASINELTMKLDASQAEIQDTIDEFKERLVALYTAGNVSTLEILLDSESLSDFTTRMQLVDSMTAHDQELVDKLEAYVDSTSAEREQVEAQKREVAELQKTLESKQDELDQLYEQTTADLVEIQGQRAPRRTSWPPTRKSWPPTSRRCKRPLPPRRPPKKRPSSRRCSSNSSRVVAPCPRGSVSYPTTGGGVEGFNPIWPLPGVTYISAGYNGYPGHKGLDIAGPYGTPVVAAEDGQVIVANNYDSWGDSWGYYVLIYHNGTYTTRYAHLSSVAVSQGQYVTAGTVVGYEGATGNVTGPHLHFEVYQNGTRVDPMQFL